MASFNIEAVRAITGLTLRQIRYWDQTGLVRPSVQAARGRGSRRLYSFEDLVELRVIARLIGSGISLQRVRRVVEYLRKHGRVNRPLSSLRLLTDGETVFVRSDDRKRWEDTLAGGQVVWVVPVDTVWQETESEVHRIGDPRRGEVRVGRSSYEVIFEPDLEDGGWIAECPALPGCVSQGDTLVEARKMIREAIIGWSRASASAAPASGRRAASWDR